MLSTSVFSTAAYGILFPTLIQLVQSRYVFESGIQRLVSQHKLVATWEEAELRCKSEGAVLASPINKELLKYMLSVITVNNHTTPYFIGTKARRNRDVQFLTEEGILLEDVPEATEMIEQLNPQIGDCLCMDAHSIRAVPCWTQLPYICYKNVTLTTNATTAPTSTTPIPTTTLTSSAPLRDSSSGYAQHGSSFYKYHVSKVSWYKANTTCDAEGAHLVIINDVAEAEFVHSFVSFYNQTISSCQVSEINDENAVWVGLRMVNKNEDWRSVQGDRLSDIYHEWAGSYTGRQECGSFRSCGKLDDFNCKYKSYFLCEK